MDDFAEQMAGVITALREEHGFDFPLYLAGIARNGVMFAATYASENDGESISCNFALDPDGPLAIPINIMVTDGRAGAARIVLGQKGGQVV